MRGCGIIFVPAAVCIFFRQTHIFPGPQGNGQKPINDLNLQMYLLRFEHRPIVHNGIRLA
jgi:hypothetical protein